MMMMILMMMMMRHTCPLGFGRLVRRTARQLFGYTRGVSIYVPLDQARRRMSS